MSNFSDWDQDLKTLLPGVDVYEDIGEEEDMAAAEERLQSLADSTAREEDWRSIREEEAQAQAQEPSDDLLPTPRKWKATKASAEAILPETATDLEAKATAEPTPKLCASCGVQPVYDGTDYCDWCYPPKAPAQVESVAHPDQPTPMVLIPQPIPAMPEEYQGTDLFRQQGELLDMDPDEARHTVNAIKGTQLRQQALLMSLHDRKGWRALGYQNWEDCLSVEFGIHSRQHYAYLQKVGAVYQVLLQSGMFESRDLTRLKDSHLATLALLPADRQPEGLVLALARAETKEYGGQAAITLKGKLTDKIVQQIVEEMKRPTMTQSAEKRAPTKPVEAAKPDQDDKTPIQTTLAAQELPAAPVAPTNQRLLTLHHAEYRPDTKEFFIKWRTPLLNEWESVIPIDTLRQLVIVTGEQI